MKVRVHAYVSGRVQGVFYRAFTCEKAMEHGVNGWVRNLATGDVEAVLEGEKEDVHRLLTDLKTGPSYARVGKIDLTYADYLGEFKDFCVRSHFNQI